MVVVALVPHAVGEHRVREVVQPPVRATYRPLDQGGFVAQQAGEPERGVVHGLAVVVAFVEAGDGGGGGEEQLIADQPPPRGRDGRAYEVGGAGQVGQPQGLLVGALKEPRGA